MPDVNPPDILWQNWLWASAYGGVAALVGLCAHWLVFGIARRAANRSQYGLAQVAVERVRRPMLLTFPLLAVQIAMPAIVVFVPESHREFVRNVLGFAMIASAVWLVVVIISIAERYIKDRHRVDVADNLEARRVHTQVTVLARTLMVFVVVIGVGAALMTLETVRELGAGLLASAGLAGLVIGFAARPVLENLIAGVQLAMTQPIRLDDVVVVEGEFGRIEHITATYVVVRIWDERRLIVPFARFITEPFQNWTRETAHILGTVFLHLDYTVPVQAVREELERLVKDHEKWDGRVCALQVTDATERTMQVRALISAASSGDAWDLRVYLREKLIDYLQREYPDALPRARVNLDDRSTDRETI